MGGKKHRRNTAKTGDKSLYKQRSVAAEKQNDDRSDDDGDAMYSKVDRFYNQQDEEDYMELTGGNKNDEEDDELMQQEAVLDLGGGDVSSSEDEDDEEEDDDEEIDNDKDERDRVKPSSLSNQEALVSSSDDEDDEEDEDDVRNWGTRKSVYYHGDTADLEIGQEEEDAFVEEEAAREVHLARMKDLSEQEFVMSDAEDDEGEEENTEKQSLAGLSSASKTVERVQHQTVGGTRDTRTWSVKEQRTFLQQHHPEFLPLVTHFTDVIQDFEKRTNVVVRALYESEQKGDKGTNRPSTAQVSLHIYHETVRENSLC